MENGITASDKILNQLRDGIIKSLKQTGVTGSQKDGMDIALCVWDKKKMKLEFSGANNPLWIIRENECVIIKPDKMPIGYYNDELVPFTKHEISLQPGDILYVATDGFEDQFGGPNCKKFMARNFRELLISIYPRPLKEQREILRDTINAWMNGHEQIDDICVFGVRA